MGDDDAAQQSLDVVPALVAALDSMNGGTGPANALLRTIATNLRRKEIAGMATLP